MNEILKEFYTVPPDVWYFVGLLIGACVAAVFMDKATAGAVIGNLFLSFAGGVIVVLVVTGWFPATNPRIMFAGSIIAAFLGNYLLHLIYDNRNMAGSAILDYIKFRRERSKDSDKEVPPNSN